MTTEHLHAIDYPLTIKILSELMPRRVASGFSTSPSGAAVDWTVLEDGLLSTTERATVTIARGISTIERCAGFPGNGSVGRAVAEAVERLR
ncbi:MAG: hypothetical protein ACYC1I_09275 [Acidimicrobiales bacterium]